MVQNQNEVVWARICEQNERVKSLGDKKHNGRWADEAEGEDEEVSKMSEVGGSNSCMSSPATVFDSLRYVGVRKHDLTEESETKEKFVEKSTEEQSVQADACDMCDDDTFVVRGKSFERAQLLDASQCSFFANGRCLYRERCTFYHGWGSSLKRAFCKCSDKYCAKPHPERRN